MAKFQLTPLDDATLAKFEAKHGKIARCVIPLRADLKVDVVWKPFDGATFDRYYDELIGAPDDAVTNAIVRQILWPWGAELDALVNAFGFFPPLIVGAMVQQAGGGTRGSPGARYDALDDNTADGSLAAAGLTREQASGLVDGSGGLVAMSLITLAGGRGALVVRAPSYGVLQRLQRAYGKKSGCAQAARQAVLDAAAWSTAKIDDMLVEFPALAANVVAPEILRLGGSDVEAQFFLGAGANRGASL